EPLREQLRSGRLENLRAIADRYGAVGDHDNVLATHHKILEIDPCDESAYGALMRLYHTQGRIGRVSDTWCHYKQAAETLGVSENPELEALYLRFTRS
ncbi:MAG: bacterial transcriptional activator domain-containing protein, partial [Desulfobacterales bacterium]|nr:bacterial transcriptional activator domain-containing protein [Desulfobacterales bacterium]